MLVFLSVSQASYNRSILQTVVQVRFYWRRNVKNLPNFYVLVYWKIKKCSYNFTVYCSIVLGLCNRKNKIDFLQKTFPKVKMIKANLEIFFKEQFGKF